MRCMSEDLKVPFVCRIIKERIDSWKELMSLFRADLSGSTDLNNSPQFIHIPYSTLLRVAWILGILITASLPIIGFASPQASNDSEDDAIQYVKSTPSDSITRLQKAIDSGTVKLEFNSKNGYLSSVLKQLNVPTSSQIL